MKFVQADNHQKDTKIKELEARAAQGCPHAKAQLEKLKPKDEL